MDHTQCRWSRRDLLLCGSASVLTTRPLHAQFGPFDTYVYQVPHPIVWKRVPFGTEKGDAIGYVKRSKQGAPIVVSVYGLGHMREQAGIGIPWLDAHLHLSGFAPWYIGVHGRGDRRSTTKLSKIADGLAAVVRRASEEGHDPTRIVLLAGGWGGLTASLLACDPRWLTNAGVPLDHLRGTVILDGAGFDLATRLAAADERRQRQLAGLIGSDDAGDLLPSPLEHAAAPNSGEFLLVYKDAMPARAREALRFADALKANGTGVTVIEELDLFKGKEVGLYASRSPKQEPIRLFCERVTSA